MMGRSPRRRGSAAIRRILVVLAVLLACSPLAPATRADAAAGTACTTGYSNKLTLRSRAWAYCPTRGRQFRVVAQCPVFQSRGPWRSYGLSETTCSIFPVRRVWMEYR